MKETPICDGCGEYDDECNCNGQPPLSPVAGSVWEDVRSKLPPKGERVLFTCLTQNEGEWFPCEIGVWKGGQSMGEAICMVVDDDDDDWQPCTHWMPLPATPNNRET